MKYFILLIVYLFGLLCGGLIILFWCAGGKGAATTRQKTRLIILTVIITAATLFGAGYGYFRYKFRVRDPENVTTEEALKDFRKENTGKSARQGFPKPGVYTFKTKGQVKVKSSLFGDKEIKLPKTLPALLTIKGDCWEINTKRSKNNESTEKYCKTPRGIFLMERQSKGEMFGFSSESRVTMGANPITGPAGTPGNTWTETTKVVNHKTTSPFRKKRPDTTWNITYMDKVQLDIGGKKVPAHHIRKRAKMSQGMKGSMEQNIWYAESNGLLLKKTIISKGKGMVNIDIDQSYELKTTEPEN